MKKLITSFLAVLVAFTVYAQTPEKALKSVELVKLDKSEVPGDVEAQVQKDFPNVGPVEIFTAADTAVTNDWKISEEIDFDEGEEIDYYHVEMKGENSYYEALYDSNSKLIMSKELQKDVALPMAVRQAYANSEYGQIPIEKDKHYKVVNHGKNKEYYQVTLQDGKKLTFNPDGTLAKN